MVYHCCVIHGTSIESRLTRKLTHQNHFGARHLRTALVHTPVYMLKCRRSIYASYVFACLRLCLGLQVNYKKDMPDIEVLMEAWPPEVEEIISNVNVLTPELDIPLEDYARMVRKEAVHGRSNETMLLKEGRTVLWW